MSTRNRFVPTARTASVIKVLVVHALVAVVGILGALTVLADTFGQGVVLWALVVVILGVQPLATILAYERFVEE